MSKTRVIADPISGGWVDGGATGSGTPVYDWPDHAGTFTEVDPTVPQYVKDITEADINAWNNPAGSTGLGLIEKQYLFEGAIIPNVGTFRYYMPVATASVDYTAWLVSPSTSGVVSFVVNRNGSPVITNSIAESATSVSGSLNITSAIGDYFTVDISNPGVGAQSLYIAFTFTRS